MAINFLKYAVLFCIFTCVNAQYDYYRSFEFDDGSLFQTRFIRPYYAQQPSRRSDTCNQYPGSTCMFVLLCLMGGGVPTGTCPGSFLSTCCLPPASPTQAVPQTTHRWSSLRTTPVQTVETSKGINTEKTTPVQFVETSKVTNAVQTTAVQSVETKMINTPITVIPTDGPPKPHNITYCGLTKAKPQSRIIGGSDAMYGEFPWQAHIKLKRQQCGGVLLNRRYVLTAAHCIYQVRLRDITIQLGAYDIQDPSRQEQVPQTFTVIEKKVHPKFKYQAAHPDRFDVALLKLDRAAHYQDNVVPICLPRKDSNFLGWKGLITGWGKTDTGLSNRYGTRLLQKVDVPIISNDQCEKWHEEKDIDITISPEMMCAGYEQGQKDACVGDSGGPLIVSVHGRWVVVGLVSAGFGCAQGKQPGIYHRVSHTVDWLRENITS